MKIIRLIICFCVLGTIEAVTAQEHPHLLVGQADKERILHTIKSDEWAAKAYNRAVKEIDPYVNRHQTNPSWILDRYLMNRIPGKRYTNFVASEGKESVAKYYGDAPVPTIRVSAHKRPPLTPLGTKYQTPELADLVPNDTSMTMKLLNPDTKMYDRVDPQSIVGSVNHKINELAFKAAVVYWLTQDEKYARFAADILNQWVKGAYYQHPIEGSNGAGFLDIQTLGDETEKPLVFAYDFVYPYMVKQKYEVSRYDKVFAKIATTMIQSGIAVNNWSAAESSTLVATALSVTDKVQRDSLMKYFMTDDYIVNKIFGQYGLPSTIKNCFANDGHWNETPGYHNFPVSALLQSAYMAERNGYKVFTNYPVLLDASYVLAKYSFPNLTLPAFGDTPRARQDMYTLELAIKFASQYKLPVLSSLLHVMNIFSKEGYDRSKSELIGLLCFMPDLPESTEKPERDQALWTTTAVLDYASFALQRNGMDKENGLMCTLQCGTYNHNHANGMAVELYGKGLVMGIDPGNGPTYEHPLHVEYYTQWGAHNTVVAAGASTSVSRYTGGGGQKDIGAAVLSAMEPVAKANPVSQHHSFVLADYDEMSTHTKQQRLLSLVRIDDTHGYYVDMYYSDNKISNDYLYHNIGDQVELYDTDGNLIPLLPAEKYPQTSKDQPGFRYYESVLHTGVYAKPVVALFSIDKYQKQMKMWIPAAPNRDYYSCLTPPAKTTEKEYQKLKLPLVTMHTEGDAETIPFVAVYEPVTTGLKDGLIQSVEQIPFNDKKCVVVIRLKSNQQQYIFKSAPNAPLFWNNCRFKGTFASITTGDKNSGIWYIGSGEQLADKHLSVTLKKTGSVSLELGSKKLYLNATEDGTLTVTDTQLVKLLSDKLKGTTLQLDENKPISFKKGKYELKF